MSEPFKLEGYEQTKSGGTKFKKSVELGGKKYKLKADIATGAITLISEGKDGKEFATLDIEKGKFVSSDKNDEDVQKLFKELKSEDGIKTKLDDTKKQVVEDVKTIQNAILENENNERSDSGITKDIFDKEDRDEVLGKTPYSTTENEEPKTQLNVSDIVGGLEKVISPENTTTRGFGPLYYPLTLEDNTQKQDIIKFTVGTYKRKKLTLNKESEIGILSGDSGFNNDSSVFLKGEGPTEIFLPIQPSITDSNIVDWNENRLDPIQVGLLQSGVSIIDDGGSGFKRTLKGFENLFKEESQQLLNAAKLLLAQEAAGAKNVLSRFGGGILNPNLELLFNGPQLRPFNFSFRLSPRSDKEATQVRTIIRAFKQSMAVKKTTGLFLAGPNVFKIEYLRKEKGGYDPHPSLNRIKTCALKSCVVDYTPENSYMTFNDDSNSMVSYNLSLQFQELDPITDVDYDNTDSIGY